MAIFTLSDFASKLRIESYRLRPNEAVSSSRSASGMTYRNQYANRLWEGELTLTPYSSDDYRELDSLISQIQDANNYFVFAPPRRKRPRNWVSGVNLGTATTSGTQALGNSLKVAGLPPNFNFVPGDMVSFLINGAYRLYELSAAATSTPTGTATFRLTMNLTDGALPPAGTAVQLLDPRVTCLYNPYSVAGGTEHLEFHEGYSFAFTQAVRAS